MTFHILVDMDGPLADFETSFYNDWRRLYPYAPAVKPAERSTFRLTDEYPPEYHNDIHALIKRQGFYRDLPPVDGAVAGLQEMLAAGFEVSICTAPYALSDYCASEKMIWVRKHLGNPWLDRLIITRDKTMVYGNILVDDRPNVMGKHKPAWRQVIFDAPYNQAFAGSRIFGWHNWRQMFKP